MLRCNSCVQWEQDQAGFAILFTPKNQNGGAPWTAVEDITFINNVVSNVASGLSFIGRHNSANVQTGTKITSKPLRRLLIERNVIEINRAEMGGSGWGIYFSSSRPDGMDLKDVYTRDITVVHNTIVMRDGNGKAFVSMGDHPYFSNGTVEVAYNLATAGDYGLFGTTASGSAHENVGEGAFDAYCGTASSFHHNVLIGLSAARAAKLPMHNTFLESIEEVGFVDPSWSKMARAPRGDYRLFHDLSPYAYAGAGSEVSPQRHPDISADANPPQPAWVALACGAATAYSFETHKCEAVQHRACAPRSPPMPPTAPTGWHECSTTGDQSGNAPGPSSWQCVCCMDQSCAHWSTFRSLCVVRRCCDHRHTSSLVEMAISCCSSADTQD